MRPEKRGARVRRRRRRLAHAAGADAAFEGLQNALKSGRISRERLDASVRRILHAKAKLGLDKDRLVDINAINHKFGHVAWQSEAQTFRTAA